MCHSRQVGTHAPSSGHHCVSGTLSPLPLGTSLPCPLPSTATPEAPEQLGFQRPTVKDCDLGENAPFSFTLNSQQCCMGLSSQFHGNSDLGPGTIHESVPGKGARQRKKPETSTCCHQNSPFLEGLRLCDLDKLLGLAPIIPGGAHSHKNPVFPANGLLLIQPNRLRNIK